MEHKRDEVSVLFENFNSAAGLAQIVYCFYGQSLKRLNVRLQVSLDHWMQLHVVCVDIANAEVLYDSAEEHHSELFVSKLVVLRVRKDKCEKLIPFFVWNQQLGETANHVCDIPLNKSDWFFDILLEQDQLCLLLVACRDLAPQRCDKFAEIDT